MSVHLHEANTQAPLGVSEKKRLGLATEGLPDTVRAAFADVSSVEEAEAYTRTLTHSHYENFSVVSVLLPKYLRQDFCNVYAFCRIADDLGDEVSDAAKALEYLAGFRQQLIDCYAGSAHTAVFVALNATIKRHDIPMKPFDDLIRAFEQDQTVTRYQTFDQDVDYCTRSADPVGRIVLYLCGYRDEERQRLSDKICTALQLWYRISGRMSAVTFSSRDRIAFLHARRHGPLRRHRARPARRPRHRRLPRAHSF